MQSCVPGLTTSRQYGVVMGGSHDDTGSSVSGDAVRRAAAPYCLPFLAIYDIWVIRLSNRFGWQCPADTMLAPYHRHAGRRHLEVGPGSGWYPAHTRFPDGAEITLTDLNRTSLAYAARRLRKAGHIVHETVASVLEPVPVPAGAGYDSIGINFVLHCVPGDFTAKGIAFTHLARVLADDGTLFGSTILGDHTPHTGFGRLLTTTYRRVGAFNNRHDTRADLGAALDAAFGEYHLTDIGDVTLFTASQPRR